MTSTRCRQATNSGPSTRQIRDRSHLKNPWPTRPDGLTGQRAGRTVSARPAYRSPMTRLPRAARAARGIRQQTETAHDRRSSWPAVVKALPDLKPNYDHPRQHTSGPGRQAQLPASMLAPRQARAAVRTVLRAWGMSALARDAELLTSELVANAAEHADGSSINLTIRQHADSGGRRGILCQVTDTAPGRPQPQPIQPDSERGRGLQIVAALATNSGVTSSPHGKTAWFTLTTSPDPALARHAEYEAEAGA